jgi:hypothetical protein
MTHDKDVKAKSQFGMRSGCTRAEPFKPVPSDLCRRRLFY